MRGNCSPERHMSFTTLTNASPAVRDIASARNWWYFQAKESKWFHFSTGSSDKARAASPTIHFEPLTWTIKQLVSF